MTYRLLLQVRGFSYGQRLPSMGGGRTFLASLVSVGCCALMIPDLLLLNAVKT